MLHLQSQTLAFLIKILGEEHPLTIQVTLFHSSTLWELTRSAEATKLQRRAYELCTVTFGDDHPLTLDVAELLGSALYLKGRWAEASMLHQTNIVKLGRLYGEDHIKTLKATWNLARLHYRYMDYEEATQLHQKAWEGMNKQLGETNLETLICLEDLAMSYFRHEEEFPDPQNGSRLLKSLKKMEFVHEQRKASLGKEHPYTLLAYFYLAQLKSAIGQHAEAERMVRWGILIAERNIGEEHTAVLMVKTHYARILVELGRLQEAEEMFRRLIEKPQYRKTSDEDGNHPDRISALWFLAGCLEKQGRLQDTLATCEAITIALQEIGSNGLGAKHKFNSRLHGKIQELRHSIGETQSATVSTSVVAEARLHILDV